ncbi:MAG: CBS domain-containing protein [Desulforhopalus sp.]
MKTAADIMSTKVITVSEDTSVRELARLLLNNNISGVPVIDADGNLIGIVTESDLVFQNKKLQVPAVIAILDSFLFLNNPDKMERELKKMAGATVKDISSGSVVSIGADTPLDEIATIMTEKKVHTLPVLSDSGQMVGIVGKKDIIRTIL